MEGIRECNDDPKLRATGSGSSSADTDHFIKQVDRPALAGMAVD